MFGIISVLIILVLLITFYIWCGNRKYLFYKVLLFIGLSPFIYNLIYSIIVTQNGFTLFDFEPVYGLKAFTSCFTVNLFFFFYIFIPSGIAIIISIINLIKLKRSNKKESC